ncbi:MAG: hypothetical protein IT287_00605 [Bdellovibrionaceae bacterium]|nr:hypothetical protein [Pseudobdellovibrionaceae bacterium]
MNKKMTIGSLVVSLMALTFLFQNCGKSQDGSAPINVSGSLDPEPVIPDPDPLPTPALLFKTGDVLNETKLPYTPTVEFKNLIKNYLKITSFKAVAMAENGIGAAQGSSTFISQAEASAVVLERCQLLSGDVPCALLAEGNKYKYDEDDFYKNRIDVLESGVRKFNPNTVPGLAYKWRVDLAGKGYMTRTNKFKAYAIGHRGTTSSGWSEASQAEANRRALEFCDATGDLACTLYAVKDDVVFNVTKFEMSKTRKVFYGPVAYSAAKVPFVTDDARKKLLADVPKSVAKKLQVVVALSRYGHYQVASNAKLAIAQKTALDKCNASLAKGATFRCFVYSKSLKVVFTRAEFVATMKTDPKP